MVAMFTERKKPCPFSKTAMEQQKDLNCLGTGSVYHCILDERNRSGEICQQPIWVPKGKVQCVIKKMVSIPDYVFFLFINFFRVILSNDCLLDNIKLMDQSRKLYVR